MRIEFVYPYKIPELVLIKKIRKIFSSGFTGSKEEVKKHFPALGSAYLSPLKLLGVIAG